MQINRVTRTAEIRCQEKKQIVTKIHYYGNFSKWRLAKKAVRKKNREELAAYDANLAKATLPTRASQRST